MRQHLKWIPILIIAGCQQSLSPEAAQHITSMESEIVLSRVFDGAAGPSLAERMEQLDVPALSIAVFENGEISWAKAYGLADVDSERAATTETLFQAASISKPVAAVAMHAMAEEGLLDLDTDVNDLLTSWQLPESEFNTEEPVTLRRIVNHTAGLTVWGFPGYHRDSTLATTVGVLAGLGNTDAIRVYKEPGESWQYSGGGYTLMQLLLADVADQAFPDIVSERVLERAGMEHGGYTQPLPDSIHDQAATGYRTSGDAVEGNWHVYPEMAAAGLWTTPSDLARFAIAVQADLTGAEVLLTSESTEAMLTGGMNGHGLGPSISPDSLRFGHGGANEGFRCQFTAFKDGRGGIAVMTNSDNGGVLAQEILLTVAREYGWPGLEPDSITTTKLSAEQFADLEGLYVFTNPNDPTDVDNVTAVERDGMLVLSTPEDGDFATLTATSALDFIELTGPNTARFEMDGETVAALHWSERARGVRQ
ncbi:MAG: CubicO group peptidase (beta-lactamase class C family) [Rhodothermales bacterium]|jgi:CubicO group peptidase (beta-lactamase class C family)